MRATMMQPKQLVHRARRAGRLCLLIAALAAAGVAAPAMAAGYKLFGTNEIQSDSLEKFNKWTEALSRYDDEKGNELDVCQPSASEKCHVARWRIFLKQIAGRPPMEQLQLVNEYLNKWLYVIDPVNYNKKDYWATPRQFMYRNGDCEDYAFAKYASLVHLGFPKDKMRIVVLNDLNLKIPHAVLVVYMDETGYLLDNQIAKVIEANRVTHYKPIFSINEQHWWLHRG
ncbi:transglutaminase-like cysteine peptidase [Marivibrio halodurans]|uniref:Transglutaminase-like cysteine peptidase n=1 Tax=Marivibrio halodurans TaxID=2039722 RepID=A0A8J7SLM2_9PROT|nr:transglutaminase-like cysteine peptidase [Marivibrio halodurans]MBP5856341.1 transglutaminase-like cysteine peptidase [Marivibrio halodurans]